LVVFERFTDRARRVVVLAQEEARLLNHNYIGTEHVLLGWSTRAKGSPRKRSNRSGSRCEPSASRSKRSSHRRNRSLGSHPVYSRSKKVLELSLREALGLGDDFIGTEHILLG